jgi:hypothetical protein
VIAFQLNEAKHNLFAEIAAQATEHEIATITDTCHRVIMLKREF